MLNGLHVDILDILHIFIILILIMECVGMKTLIFFIFNINIALTVTFNVSPVEVVEFLTAILKHYAVILQILLFLNKLKECGDA